MVTLLEKANEILAEKNEKVKPGNIKKDVVVFNVTGNYDGSENKIKVPNFVRFDSASMFSEFYGGTSHDSESDSYAYPKENWDSLINFYKNLDFSELKDFSYMFAELYFNRSADDGQSSIYYPLNLDIDTSSGKIFNNMFSDSCISNAPELDLSNAVSTYLMFNSCRGLTDVPVYSIHTSLDDLREMAEFANKELEEYLHDNFISGMFGDCDNLSEESLNNILAMLADEDFPMNKVQPPYAHWKLLNSVVGLSLDQCNACMELENWRRCSELGWEPYAPLN